MSVESTDQQEGTRCNRGLMGLSRFLYSIPKSFKNHDLLLPVSDVISLCGFKMFSPLCIAAATLTDEGDSFHHSGMVLYFNSKPFPATDVLLLKNL